MNKFTKYPHLYEPIKIGKITAKNRIEVPPMGPKLGTIDFRVTEQQLAFYEERAMSGAAIITVPDTSVDHQTGTTNAQNYYINGQKSVCELKKLVNVIHRHGALASIELNHGGWEANGCEGTAFTVSEIPTEVSILPEFQMKGELKVMTEEDIQYVIGKYAEAAAVCKAAGFDMVMIHAAHGSLPAQFISPQGNHRTDRYGGDADKRMTFHKELFGAIRAAVGPDFPVEVRVSGQEWEPDGMKTEDVIYYLKEIQHLIDLVHVSSGFGACLQALSPYYFPRNVHVEAAAKIKAALDIPVNVVSAIVTLENAENLIAEGKVDMVAMGRTGLADPKAFEKGCRGLTDDDIRPCVRCSHCQSNVAILEQIGCTVNPRLGAELSYPLGRKPARKKKVVIVGGGPGGMEAARDAVEQGHEVVLFEKSDKLGGMLPTISAQSFKGEFRRYYEWAVRATMSCGADIRLNTTATPELIAAEKPDAVIIAVGGKAIVLPSIPLSEKVVLVDDVDAGTAKVGERVVIAGGGVAGVECAMELADAGKQVTIVDMKPINLWAGVLPLHYFLRMALLEQKGVACIPDTGVVKETEGGILVKDKDGNERELPADTVILAIGKKPDSKLVEELSSVVPETYVIGTAKHDGEVYNATHDAFYAVMEL